MNVRGKFTNYKMRSFFAAFLNFGYQRDEIKKNKEVKGHP
jgi:hypothetical protein